MSEILDPEIVIVDGRSMALRKQGPAPGLYCQDPKFVVVG